MREVDVAIIGAGSAGLTARREVAKRTQRYVVIDHGELGTTCARMGCMPSKTLIQVAEDYHRRMVFAKEGILGAEGLSVDLTLVLEHVRQLRDRFVRSVLHEMDSWAKTHLLRATAVFLDRQTIKAGDEIIRARKTILATGSRPYIPRDWEEFRFALIDSDSVFEQTHLPEKIAVVGLGVIGLELGQALQRLGLKVMGFSLGTALGGLTDPLIRDSAVQKFTQEMELSFAGAEIVEASRKGIKVLAGGRVREFDKVLVAIGRKPNLDGIGLENLGLEYDRRGVPLYDPATCQVKDAPLFIAGDANGDRPVLHEAADEGRIAGYNSVRDVPERFQRRTPLIVTYSMPQIAVIGESWLELKERRADFVTGSVSFEGQGRAIVKMEETGKVHIYGERVGGRILGAELIAPEAEHLAHLLAWCISSGLSVQQVLSLPFYHPVLEEGLRTAFRDLAKQTEGESPPLELMRCEDPPAAWSE